MAGGGALTPYIPTRQCDHFVPERGYGVPTAAKSVLGAGWRARQCCAVRPGDVAGDAFLLPHTPDRILQACCGKSEAEPRRGQLGNTIRRHADGPDLMRVGGRSDRDLPPPARAYRTFIARACTWTLAALQAQPGRVEEPEPGWRPGDNVLVDLPDGQTPFAAASSMSKQMPWSDR